MENFWAGEHGEVLAVWGVWGEKRSLAPLPTPWPRHLSGLDAPEVDALRINW